MEVVTRPIGCHQYHLQPENWSELADNVLDIFNRTQALVADQDMKWEVDIRLRDCQSNKFKCFNCHANDFKGTSGQRLMGVMTIVFEVVKKYSGRICKFGWETVVEVRYLQEDFIATLDIYEEVQERFQEDAGKLVTPEEREAYAREAYQADPEFFQKLFVNTDFEDVE